MKNQDNPALRDILMQVAELPPGRRGEFLDSACAGSSELRAEVESLLRSLEREDELLREPTIAGETVRSGDGNGTGERLGEGPGARIGRYKLLEQIGEGGFGVVFMAEQRDPVRRRVALKIIKLGMDTKQVVLRFEAERQALAMMDHPNIAKVLDGGATDMGRPYFVMELVRGVPITAFCDENRLTTQKRLELFIAVCSALQHAHQKGIIHRDLKPGNVLVTMHDDKPVPKIIDFGVAKAINQRLTEHTLFTEFRQFVGTPAYMSPEQAQMSGLDIDTRSDIYSLGVLLYELLTGTTPFESKELLRGAYEEMQRIIREVEPPKPSTRLSTLGEGLRTLAVNMATEPRRLSRIMAGELDWIVMKCLEKDRERRYSTAIGLATDIERHLKGDPVEASPPSVVYRVRKFVRKHDALVGVGVFLLLAASFSTWQALRAIRAADAALTQKNRADQQAQVARAQTAEADRQRKEVETQKAQVTREKVEAQKQEHIASSVNKFLSYMLTRADPDKLMGDKVTVVQAIAAAEKQLDTEIQQGAAGGAAVDPLVEAAIRGTIGNSLRKLGRYDQGERNLRRSLEILRKVTPASYVDLATSESDLGTLLAEQNKLEEGEKLQREALDLYRKALPAGHPFIASCLINLGQVLGREGRMKEAESSYREALSIDRKALPAGSPELRSSLSNLGLLLTDLNELDESERLFREALEIDRKSLPAGHPEIASDLNNLASLLARRGNTDDAEATFREALAINRKAYPAGDPALSRNLSDLALLLAGQNKVQEAEAMYREALGIDRKIWPADHPDIARKLNGLATLLSHDGRLEEAEKMYRDAIEIDRKSLPADHPDIAIHLDNLTVLLLRQNRVSDAEKLQREALEFDRKSLPAGHPQIASHLTHVAVLLGRQNRPHDAEVLYREALDIERSAPPNAHTDIGVTLNDFAYLLLGQNRLAESERLFRELVELERKNHAPATSRGMHLHVLANVLQREDKLGEAEPLMREALALRRDAYPSGSTAIAGTLTDLALLLQKLNRLAEAESLYREALKTYTSAPKPDDVAIANVSSGLGRTLLSENKYAEAEPFLRNALAIRDRQLGQTNVATVRTASALADLLDRTGRPDDANQLRQSHGISLASTRPAHGALVEGK